jgi:hypothetical protein
VTYEEHVCVGALALGLPNRAVLYVTVMSTFHLGPLPLDCLIGRSQYVTLGEHVSFQALALKLPNREVLYVTVMSTFRLGR